jgi:FtsZ-interacting cell division protein YlmF
LPEEHIVENGPMPQVVDLEAQGNREVANELQQQELQQQTGHEQQQQPQQQQPQQSQQQQQQQQQTENMNDQEQHLTIQADKKQEQQKSRIKIVTVHQMQRMEFIVQFLNTHRVVSLSALRRAIGMDD